MKRLAQAKGVIETITLSDEGPSAAMAAVSCFMLVDLLSSTVTREKSLMSCCPFFLLKHRYVRRFQSIKRSINQADRCWIKVV